jgi:hypothetical protein
MVIALEGPVPASLARSCPRSFPPLALLGSVGMTNGSACSESVEVDQRNLTPNPFPQWKGKNRGERKPNLVFSVDSSNRGMFICKVQLL